MTAAVETTENRAAAGSTSAGAVPGTTEQLEARVNELIETLAQTREALDHAERRHQIDLALIQADAIDLETARLLTEQTLQQMSDRDVARAVRELRQRKAFLFRNPAQPRATPGGRSAPGAMGPRAQPGPSPQLRASAAEAATTGDRAALLRYLRARRGG